METSLHLLEMIKIECAQESEADEIKIVINESYSVELGYDGVACKKVPRLLDSLEPTMKRAYLEQRVLKAIVERDDGTKSLAGIIVWEFDVAERVIHFGPFSVVKEFNGKGVGRALVAAVERIGREKRASNIEIYIINHRSDLFPLYEYWGFKDTGKRIEYPYPDRLTRPSSFFVYYRPIILKNEES